jgi:tRNA-2-methylthio-N6-dimethylallyladenosine synthase
MIEASTNKVILEERQGEALEISSPTLANGKKLYLESYGCQMNFSDSEIVASILQNEGFDTTSDLAQADLVFLNTCSIREKAEQTVRKRLQEFRKHKESNPALLIGVLGCMAERLKAKFLEEEKLVTCDKTQCDFYYGKRCDFYQFCRK